MKFNWGTGIFIVIVLFLTVCAAFIIFALNQDINLIHKDYYEKGVDYSDQLDVINRSEAFKDKISAQVSPNGISVKIDSLVASKIDSGLIYLYRPSGKDFDLEFPLKKNQSEFQIGSDKLIEGRYILKFSWHYNALKYEVDKPVIVEK